jgi:2-dehydropantoate 2-reductase
MPERRIAILGTGANGASIGADLTRAGLDVVFIEQWPAHVEAMRRHGLRIETSEGRQTTRVRAIHLCEVAELQQRFDVVLVAVKAYDTRWACELIRPYLREDGLAVGLQNGLTVDDMSEILGEHRTLAAVIEQSAALYEPGLVERHTPLSASWFAVGSPTPATAGRELEIADLLKHSGTVEVPDDIISAKWMKLVVNCAELVTTAIVDLPMREAIQLPGMHRVMFEAGYEAIRVAIAAGQSVVPLFGLADPPKDRPEELVDAMMDAVLHRFSIPQTRTTVLHDWMKGRHSEVNELNGHVARLAPGLGVPAPVNARVVEIAGRIERGELDRGPDNAALLADPVVG